MRIGRYDNPFKCVSYSSIDADARQDHVVLEAADGGLSQGTLYTKGRHKTVVCFMHPKADMSRHYGTPYLLAAGYAVFGQNSRWLNNDELCVHEMLLLDVAAGIRFLRHRGFEHIVLIGNSGGGSLYTFYQAQASTAPPGRLERTPAGDVLDLNGFELPPADGLIHLAAHPGEGVVLMHMIDPSVVDERDPLAADPEFDPYNPANGYRQPPEPSHYAPEFVQRYRQAQRARIARLDAVARAHLQRRSEGRRGMRSLAEQPWIERAAAERAAVFCPFMVVYRTEADLRALDPSIDPSERGLGTLFSYRPDLTNYMEFGFGRVSTPRAWLSTWSGLSSNANVQRNAPQVKVPSLVVYYTGDNAIFPSDAKATYESLGSDDKQIVGVPGDHYGFAVGTQERLGAPHAFAAITSWLEQRFGA